MNPMIGHDWGVINERLHNGFILVMDALILLATIYHAGYGVVSVCRIICPLTWDSLPSRRWLWFWESGPPLRVCVSFGHAEKEGMIVAPALKIQEVMDCDFLIVGAGGAGLRCAAHILEKRPGAKVVALTKVAHCQKSHTAVAQGGLAAVDPKDPVDRFEYHMFDTWKGSDCTADQNVIKKVVEAAWEQIIWLENRGMHFSRDEQGGLARRTFGGHTLMFGEASAFRAVFEADRTGKGIVDTTWGESLKVGTVFLNQCLATELIIKNNRCLGAVAFLQKQGRFLAIRAKTTLLATGGSGQVFRVTTNCRQNTGDGLALALAAGLPVMDPEAVQFHPTGIVGPGILVSEALRSEGGILRNKDQEAFMERYAPKMKDLAPRDIVARAIETEIREGRGVYSPEHGIDHVWIDVRHLPDYVHDVKLKEISGFFAKFAGKDPKHELCPVRPSNHYHMGGIPTDDCGRVQNGLQGSVEALFAIGECASASFHGFNRLGTNSILELITMGKFAGETALEYLDEPLPDLPGDLGAATFARFSAYLDASRADNLEVIRETLRNEMTQKASVFRDEQGLTDMLEIIKELRERADSTALVSKSLAMNPELLAHWEVDNLLDVSQLIAFAARERRESRGGHFRDDYPQRKDEYNHHTLAFLDASHQVELGQKPVDQSILKAGGKNSDKFAVIERRY